jgi:hypothetical protein
MRSNSALITSASIGANKGFCPPFSAADSAGRQAEELIFQNRTLIDGAARRWSAHLPIGKVIAKKTRQKNHNVVPAFLANYWTKIKFNDTIAADGLSRPGTPSRQIILQFAQVHQHVVSN